MSRQSQTPEGRPRRTAPAPRWPPWQLPPGVMFAHATQIEQARGTWSSSSPYLAEKALGQSAPSTGHVRCITSLRGFVPNLHFVSCRKGSGTRGMSPAWASGTLIQREPRDFGGFLHSRLYNAHGVEPVSIRTGPMGSDVSTHGVAAALLWPTDTRGRPSTPVLLTS